MRRLIERGWVAEVGARDVPGHPALFATTREFLSYFNLESLKELPPLSAERAFGEVAAELDAPLPPELLAALRDSAHAAGTPEIPADGDGAGDGDGDLSRHPRSPLSGGGDGDGDDDGEGGHGEVDGGDGEDDGEDNGGHGDDDTVDADPRPGDA